MVEFAKVFVEKHTKGDSSGHDYFHTLRVLHLAETIARAEQKTRVVDMEAVQLIALLHDVDDRKLSPETHENLDRARGFLRENGAAPLRTQMILDSIRNLSFGGTGANVPASIEGKIVQDADRLDAMGAIGIARTFAYGGSKGRRIHDSAGEDKTTSVQHFYDKLLKLENLMNTETGQKLARERHIYMEEFLRRFYAEWEGTE